MTQPRPGSLVLPHQGGSHRLAFVAWGPVEADQVVVCVHGLTRNGRDFDTLAAALSASARVLCPDIAGRGQSEWLPDPALYSYPQYLADMRAFLAHLAPGPVDWVGTSMGGLIGLMLAAQADSPIRRLVLNDVGPFVPRAALARIGRYVGAETVFADPAAVEHHLRRIHAGFGPLSDADWAALARHGRRALPEGGFAPAYDPKIAVLYRQRADADVDLWPLWRRVGCPVLVIHGLQSDVLTADTVARMVAERPGTEILEVPEAGHAPALVAPGQIAAIRRFLGGRPVSP